MSDVASASDTGADREGEEAGWEGQGAGKKLLDNFSGSSFTV